MSFNLIRPLNQAVLVMYVFTQGLTFRQNFFVMLPIYALLEIGRSVSFVTLRSLDAIQLMRCCGVLLLVVNIIATSAYLTTINKMQQFYTINQCIVHHKNLEKIYDKLDEGILIYRHQIQIETNQQEKASFDDLEMQPAESTSRINLIDVKLCNRYVRQLINC